MNHEQIIHKHINPVLQKYNTSVDEITGNWRVMSPKRKRELAACIVDCLECGNETVWYYFVSKHKRTDSLTGKMHRWNY